MDNKTTLRERSLEWFFNLNQIEKVDLKNKYFPNEYIEYDSHWGFHFNFGQIEEMFTKNND